MAFLNLHELYNMYKHRSSYCFFVSLDVHVYVNEHTYEMYFYKVCVYSFLFFFFVFGTSGRAFTG